MEEHTSRGFDDLAKEAAANLLENFWILRSRDLEKYQQVRQREDVLRKWFMDKAGLRLVVHRYFAKLEKVPAFPLPWMGMPDFLGIRDYTLFCCVLAFLEGRAVEEQFVLSHLCEELLTIYPVPDDLDWNNYEHRKSLVRVLRQASDLGILLVVDGEVEQFSKNEVEVLYEVPAAARYFMRSFPRGLTELGSPEEILASELVDDLTDRRRHRIYRQLLFCPALYSGGVHDMDFLYLRNYRPRLREDFEQNFDFQFELYRNVAMLTLPERGARYDFFPGNRAIEDIAVQFAGLAREKRAAEDIPLQYDGSLCLPRSSFLTWVAECEQRYAVGWSKQYREMDTNGVAKDLLDLLLEWQLASVDAGSGVVNLLPALAKFSGSYPPDFGGREEDLQNG